jgi:hypothetical protein
MNKEYHGWNKETSLCCLERQNRDTASRGINTIASNLASISISCDNLINGFYGAACLLRSQTAIRDVGPGRNGTHHDGRFL